MFGLGMGSLGQERVLGRSLAATLSENFLETSLLAVDQVLLEEFLRSFARLFKHSKNRTGKEGFPILKMFSNFPLQTCFYTAVHYITI